MDGANKAHYKMLMRTIKYVSDTKTTELVLKPNKGVFKWSMKAYCDSDFAGDVEHRKSVSGFIIYINGCPISWRSRGQKSVTLSSTEAEYVAISEVSTEILYILHILRFLGLQIELPIEVNVDNIGAIYLSQNASTGNRTKQIDTRYHFVREYIENGTLKIKFTKSEFKHVDIFTKTTTKETFKRLSEQVMNGSSKLTTKR